MIINQVIEYNPTPEELAEEFCKFYENGQVKFLNKVAEIFSKKPNNLAMQLEYITQEGNLTDDARYLMSVVGDYASHNQNYNKIKGE